MNPAAPNYIIRCLKRDFDGDLVAAYRYAERIAWNARNNIFAFPGDAEAYAEAARRLRAEHVSKLGPTLSLADQGYSDNY